jgi:fluoride exporter
MDTNGGGMTESQFIGFGGALGLGGRHLIGRLFAGALGLGFPHYVVLTNLVGPLLLVLGLHLGWRSALEAEQRIALTTGAVGGVMLLATVNRDTNRLILEGPRATALLVIVAAVVGCLIAGGVGLVMARAMA